MKIQVKRNVAVFFAIVLVSSVAGVLLYRPFFVFLNRIWGPFVGYSSIRIPPYSFTEPIVPIFDFSYVFFLALFLSFPFSDWRDTLRFWAYGYLLLIGLSLLAAGIYIPDPLRLLFILLSASVGFLIGQGIRFLLVRTKVVK